MSVDIYAVKKRLAEIISDSPYRTKTDFCAASGISPQILGNYQNPKTLREPPKSILKAVAKLGYSTQWLLWGLGKMHHDPKAAVLSNFGTYLTNMIEEGSRSAP